MSHRLTWVIMGWLAGACWSWSDTFAPQLDDRMSAITGLMKVRELPPSPEVITKLIGYAGWQDPSVARDAVRRLGEIGPPAAEAIPVLVEGLKRLTAAGGENQGAQFPASPPYAWALAQMGPGRWDVLTALLEAGAGEAARRSFGHQNIRSWQERSENGNELLRRAALESNLPVGQRRMALMVLSMAGDSELVPQLQELAREPGLRSSVNGYALRARGDATKILPTLVDLAVSQAANDVQFARGVFIDIGNRGSAENTPLIRKLLSHVFDPLHPFGDGWSPPEPQPVKSMATSALIGISRHAVVEMVGPYLDDPFVEIRCGVASACWSRLAEGEWATRLRSRLNAEDEVERTAFAATLIQVPSCRSEAERVLVRSATSNTLTNVVRKLALTALGMNPHQNKMGPEVREGVEQCARDPDALVRETARKILEYETSQTPR